MAKNEIAKTLLPSDTNIVKILTKVFDNAAHVKNGADILPVLFTAGFLAKNDKGQYAVVDKDNTNRAMQHPVDGDWDVYTDKNNSGLTRLHTMEYYVACAVFRTVWPVSNWVDFVHRGGVWLSKEREATQVHDYIKETIGNNFASLQLKTSLEQTNQLLDALFPSLLTEGFGGGVYLIGIGMLLLALQKCDTKDCQQMLQNIQKTASMESQTGIHVFDLRESKRYSTLFRFVFQRMCTRRTVLTTGDRGRVFGVREGSPVASNYILEQGTVQETQFALYVKDGTIGTLISLRIEGTSLHVDLICATTGYRLAQSALAALREWHENNQGDEMHLKAIPTAVIAYLRAGFKPSESVPMVWRYKDKDDGKKESDLSVVRPINAMRMSRPDPAAAYYFYGKRILSSGGAVRNQRQSHKGGYSPYPNRF